MYLKDVGYGKKMLAKLWNKRDFYKTIGWNA